MPRRFTPDWISYADFLAYAEAHDGKFEFVDGHIIAQAKPTKRHQRLAIALGNLLADHVQTRGCDVLPDTTLVLSDANDNERAPDLMSPAIEAIYRTTKYARYAGRRW